VGEGHLVRGGRKASQVGFQVRQQRPIGSSGVKLDMSPGGKQRSVRSSGSMMPASSRFRCGVERRQSVYQSNGSTASAPV
jgi:hypothetical protein